MCIYFCFRFRFSSEVFKRRKKKGDEEDANHLFNVHITLSLSLLLLFMFSFVCFSNAFVTTKLTYHQHHQKEISRRFQGNLNEKRLIFRWSNYKLLTDCSLRNNLSIKMQRTTKLQNHLESIKNLASEDDVQAMEEVERLESIARHSQMEQLLVNANTIAQTDFMSNEHNKDIATHERFYINIYPSPNSTDKIKGKEWSDLIWDVVDNGPSHIFSGLLSSETLVEEKHACLVFETEEFAAGALEYIRSTNTFQNATIETSKVKINHSGAASIIIDGLSGYENLEEIQAAWPTKHKPTNIKHFRDKEGKNITFVDLNENDDLRMSLDQKDRRFIKKNCIFNIGKTPWPTLKLAPFPHTPVYRNIAGIPVKAKFAKIFFYTKNAANSALSKGRKGLSNFEAILQVLSTGLGVILLQEIGINEFDLKKL